MRIRAPRVRKGQAITARLWNQMSDAVDPDWISPTDLGAGVSTQEKEEGVGERRTTFLEIARTSDTVRVTNPEDENQYVDVERLRAATFIGAGTRLTLVFRA